MKRKAKEKLKKRKNPSEMTADELIEQFGYNTRLMEQIQPVGGISFKKDEKYISTGEGYEAVIHIYEYPKKLSVHWLLNIVNLKNTVTVLDISTENQEDVIVNINRSIREQNSRYATAKNVTEQMDAQQRYEELQTLYDEVATFGEVVKLVTIRIFIAAQTYTEVDKRAKEIINSLDTHNFKAAIFLNEGKPEWKSMYQTYTEQQETEYKRYGQPMQSEMLAVGNPFHFSSLSDKFGSYFGYTTSSSGSVLFDLFHLDSHRMSYNGFIFGRMGSGKSSLLKKILLDRAVRGDYIRGFDVTGEFTPLVEHLGGTVLSYDGTTGIINDLEVLRIDENDKLSFASHISKLATIYKLHAPDCDNYEIAEYQKTCNELYEKWGLLKDDAQITGLPNEAYPTYSDLLAFVKEKLDYLYSQKDTGVRHEQMVLTMKRLNNIDLVLSELISTYGYMVDGHTTIKSLLDKQIVYFNVKHIAGMKDCIFNSRIYSMLSLFWDNGVQIGSRMKDLFDRKKIDLEDIIHFLILVDEAHHFINTEKPMIVDQITQNVREGRKYFISMLFATQSIRDCIQEGSSQVNVTKIKILFELTQYKFLMQQDSNARDLLGTVFHQELTSYQLDRIPRLGKGECILTISGDSNIEFTIELTEDEKQLISGGA